MEPSAVEEDPDVASRVRALEARVRRMEQTAARAAPDLDAVAEGIEELAAVVAEEVISGAVEGLRATIAAEVAGVRADAGAAAESIRRDVSALVERQAHLVRRELAQDVVEARGELRRAFTPSTPQAYLPHRRYGAGEVVTHKGGAWQQISANGSTEAPGENAASWLLISDGIREVRAHAAAGDNGDVVLDVVFASGRSMGSKLSGVLPRYCGPFKPGTSYRALDFVHRDGALFLCRQPTGEDPRADTGAWALAASRGERGSGPSTAQMTIAENYLATKLAESGTPRDRVAEAVEAADDAWLLARERHGGTVQEYSRAAVAGAVVAVAGSAARPDAEALAERVAAAAVNASREEGHSGDVRLEKAVNAIRTAALTVASAGRAERLAEGLEAHPDRVLRSVMRTLVGR